MFKPLILLKGISMIMNTLGVLKSSSFKQGWRNFDRLANVKMSVLEIFLVVFEGRKLRR